MKMILHPIDLKLRHAFTISYNTRTSQPGLVVELHDGGHSGYGEASAINYYGQTVEGMTAALEKLRSEIESFSWNTPDQLWDHVYPSMKDTRFALCALDQAAHDLWGKRHGKPVYELWGLVQNGEPLSDYTIGIDDTAKMVEKLLEFDGWPIYKIKLGTDHDIDIIRELRKHTDAVFRVDANVAWTAEQTIANSRPLKELGVEFIEQPLQADDWKGMAKVYAESALPVIADESCIVEEDVDKCKSCFHGVNVKLTKAGGLTPGKRMLEHARSLGLKTMVGCMTESTVGISAIGQLLPLLDYVDMDGAVLLGEDVADGVYIDKGLAKFPDTPGNGVTWRGKHVKG